MSISILNFKNDFLKFKWFINYKYMEKKCTLHLKKLVSSIVSLTLLSPDGLRMVKSDTLKLKETNIDTGLTQKMLQQLKTILQIIELLSCTEESLQPNKKKILIDKLDISLKSIPTPKSYLTSVRVLISTGNPYNPYLKRSLWEQYPLLLFLIKIVSLGLDLNGLNSSVNPMTRNSLLSMTKTTPLNLQGTNWLKTYLQSLIVSPPKCTPTENIQETRTIYKTKKTKVIQSKVNKEKNLSEYLRGLSDLYNVSWNKGVNLVRDMSKSDIKNRIKWIKDNRKTKTIKKTKKMTKKQRKMISREIQKSKRRIQVNTKKLNCSTFIDTKMLEKKIINVEYRTPRQLELCSQLKYNGKTLGTSFSNINAIMKSQRTKKKYLFNLSYRSRKMNRIVTFNQRDYKGFKKSFGEINGVEEMTNEFKFMYDKKLKEWFLLTLEPTKVSTITNHTPRVCSLDPGVREFQKIFSLNEGCVYTAGSSTDIKKIVKLKKEMEFLKEKSKTNPSKKIKRIRNLKSTKVSNKLKDAHWKLSSFLTEKYDVIILPEFKTQDMMKKKGSCLSKKTRKDMRDWCHYKFKEKLRWMCIKKNKTLVDGKEYYTSKTCCICLKLNDCGGSKEYKCSYCPNNIDRDINGAINNLLIMIK